MIVCLSQLQLYVCTLHIPASIIGKFGLLCDLVTCCVQALSYDGYPTVEVLRTAPAPDEPIVHDSQSIAVRGADGGLMFGPSPDTMSQTVFDTAFYRPVNTTFTGDACH